MKKGFMDTNSAFEIVIQLARRNIPKDPSEDMSSKVQKQIVACDTVEDFFVNNIADE